MARVQLALRVSDLDRAVEFYSRLFSTPPAKVRPGYANFAIDQPPLKLVLIEAKEGGVLDHLGVEVDSVDQVVDASREFEASGLPTRREEEVECCYARQDKVWVSDPDGIPWEWYTVLGDSDRLEPACC
ncbi:MAG: glyoxalase [Acidimicrobiia bacterium]|nr:MAG: glyoxalase [Acidimicrobiia bacterium]